MGFRDKMILVTGASGFIGSWLIEALLEQNAEPVTIVRDDVPTSMYFNGADKKAITIHGNLENYALVERVINEYEIGYILNLGAQAIVKTANNSPLSTFESNIKGTWNVLEAARHHDKMIKALVIASSDKAYGDHEKLPYAEDMPLQPHNPYDASKACADMLAISYASTYGMKIGISRCGNVFGGGDLNFSRIVPGTIRSLFFNERPMIRSDGGYVRDYLYVKDVVQSYLKLLEKTEEKKFQGEVFNFSYERPLSVLEIVAMVSKLMKKGLKPDVKNMALKEIKKQYLSCKKSRDALGWKPAYDLESGLSETIDWYSSFLKMKNK